MADCLDHVKQEHERYKAAKRNLEIISNELKGLYEPQEFDEVEMNKPVPIPEQNHYAFGLKTCGDPEDFVDLLFRMQQCNVSCGVFFIGGVGVGKSTLMSEYAKRCTYKKVDVKLFYEPEGLWFDMLGRRGRGEYTAEENFSEDYIQRAYVTQLESAAFARTRPCHHFIERILTEHYLLFGNICMNGEYLERCRKMYRQYDRIIFVFICTDDTVVYTHLKKRSKIMGTAIPSKKGIEYFRYLINQLALDLMSKFTVDCGKTFSSDFVVNHRTCCVLTNSGQLQKATFETDGSEAESEYDSDGSLIGMTPVGYKMSFSFLLPTPERLPEKHNSLVYPDMPNVMPNFGEMNTYLLSNDEPTYGKNWQYDAIKHM